MKILVLLSLFAYIGHALELSIDLSTCRNHFNKWKSLHNKQYSDSV